MKITLDTIAKKIKEDNEKRKALESKRNALEAAVKEAQNKALNAATSGDVSGYMAAKAEEKQKNAEAYVASMQIANLGKPFSREEVRAAWKEYANSYNEELDKRIKKYLSDRAALWKEYKDILTLQNEALKKRKRCAEMIGNKEDDGEFRKEFPMNVFPCERPLGLMYGNSNVATPEVAFFMGSGEATEEDHDFINKVLRLNIAVE